MSGRAGHHSHCFSVGRALGVEPLAKRVRACGPFSALAPYGPLDPRDAPSRPGSPIAPPFPDIVFASGRRTVPYVRRLRAASRGRTFTVFLEDPRVGAGLADIVWVPAHDRLRGGNVVVTATSPHGLVPAVLAAARERPDPRVAALRAPRAALLLGGDSRRFRFTDKDRLGLARLAAALLAQGFGVLATPSRRTDARTLAAVRDALVAAPERAFLWEGAGDNPYRSMLALADAIVVTADSVSMVSEALATSAPVYVYEPTGGDAKTRRFLDGLIAQGALRRWDGRIEMGFRTPLDATPAIAAEIAWRYALFAQTRAAR